VVENVTTAGDIFLCEELIVPNPENASLIQEKGRCIEAKYTDSSRACFRIDNQLFSTQGMLKMKKIVISPPIQRRFTRI
jgi:hypothetical protein